MPLETKEVKESDLDKLAAIASSAILLDAVGNVVNPLLAPIHQTARRAANYVNNNTNFVRIGDSTKSMLGSEWQFHDELLFSQINIAYYNNASPSQTAYDWLNNIDQNTFAQFLANCRGIDGEDTIVEFSLGLNDFTAYGNTPTVKPQVKQILLDSINAILTAKPKVKLYLASPHYAQNEYRRICLDEVYKEIAIEKNLYLVDGLKFPIGPTFNYNNTDLYYDGTHLNQFGSLSLNFRILNEILPLDVLKCIEFSEYEIPQLEGNLALGTTLLTGIYTNLALNSNANYRHIAIDVPINSKPFKMKFKHKGNRNQIHVLLQDNTLLQVTPNSLDANGYYPFFCPIGVKKIYVNITTDYSAYSLLTDTIEVLYNLNIRPFIPYSELTANFKSNITHTNLRRGIQIDNYGKTGTIGQMLKVDSNNMMKWSV